MPEIPPVLYVSAAVVFIAAMALGLYFFTKRQHKNSLIAAIKHGQGVLTKWDYAPPEWQWAAQNHFEIKAKSGDYGKVFFTARHLYLTDGRRDYLHELVGAAKFTRHLTEVYLLKDSPLNVIKFTVRSKQIKKDEYGNDTMDEDCEIDYFYVPIPKNRESETEKVMKFYQDILDQNADAVAAVMPFGLGLFGR